MSLTFKKFVKNIFQPFQKGDNGSKRMRAIAIAEQNARMQVSRKKGLQKPGQYSFKVLRSIAYTDAIIRIAINVIKKTVSQSKWQIRVKDRHKKIKGAEKKYEKEIEELYELFENMNTEGENMRILLERLIEDILVLDAGACEIIRSNDGEKITGLNSVDGATIRPVVNKYGESGNEAYIQYIDEEQVASFSKDELFYIMANPQNSVDLYGYGMSHIESIMMQVQASLEAEMSNMKKFSTNNVPAGLLDLGDTSDEEAENIIATWNATVIGNNDAMKFIRGSGSDRKYVPFQGSNKDMQYSQYIEWLSRIKLATFGLTAQDANIDTDLNRSTAEVHASLSNARGVKAMKRLLEEYFTRNVVRKFSKNNDNFKKLEFAFVDVDTLADKKTRAEIDKINVDTGIYSAQFVQERDGYPIEDIIDQELQLKMDSLLDKQDKKKEEQPKFEPKKEDTEDEE